MYQNATNRPKEPKAHGVGAAAFAGLSLGMVAVTIPETSGDLQLTLLGAAALSLICAFAGARMEASFNKGKRDKKGKVDEGKLNKLTLFLVAVMAVVGALPAYLKLEVPPEVVMFPMALTVVATIFAAVGHYKAKKNRNSSGWNSGWK